MARYEDAAAEAREDYLMDLNGFRILKNVLSADECRELTGWLDQHGSDSAAGRAAKRARSPSSRSGRTTDVVDDPSGCSTPTPAPEARMGGSIHPRVPWGGLG